MQGFINPLLIYHMCYIVSELHLRWDSPWQSCATDSSDFQRKMLFWAVHPGWPYHAQRMVGWGGKKLFNMFWFHQWSMCCSYLNQVSFNFHIEPNLHSQILYLLRNMNAFMSFRAKYDPSHVFIVEHNTRLHHLQASWIPEWAASPSRLRVCRDSWYSKKIGFQ